MLASSHKRRVSAGIVLLLVLLAGFSRRGDAQVSSGTATVALTAILAESLTVVATPAAAFTLLSGTQAIVASPVVITTTWITNPTRGAVTLYAWFATPAVALTDSASTPDNIPSSEVYGLVSTGLPTTYTAFTQSNTIGTASGGLKLFSQTLTTTTHASSRIDNLSMEIDLTSQPNLPAGTYLGTLNLQAQAL